MMSVNQRDLCNLNKVTYLTEIVRQALEREQNKSLSYSVSKSHYGANSAGSPVNTQVTEGHKNRTEAPD